ncbi:MAG: sigma 54-interacting transcriptional regulator, partial [Cystobacter sp.]
MTSSDRTRGTSPRKDDGVPVEGPGGLDAQDLSATRPYTHGSTLPEATAVRRFLLTVVEGPEPGTVWDSVSDVCSIGSHPSNDFHLDDSTVSRFHCEIRVSPRGARVKDLDSTNGVMLDGVQVAEGYLRGGSLLRLGRVVVRFDYSTDNNRLPVSERTRFGSLVGVSVPMRMCFALLERAAGRDVTVLLEGETGTGKSQAAQAIHQASARRDKPFLTVDCGAIPADLLESELFGHEKGAFTGAATRRIGAFEEAHGGTVFLDEIGELPAELQPKLLRVLEAREIRRVGTNAYVPVDVRIIAATNRDLRAEVNAGRFRSDLFFRLAVLRISVPPLAERQQDIPALARQFAAELGAPPLAPETIAELASRAYPGNVRELRNAVAAFSVLGVLPVSTNESPLIDIALSQLVDLNAPYAT